MQDFSYGGNNRKEQAFGESDNQSEQRQIYTLSLQCNDPGTTSFHSVHLKGWSAQKRYFCTCWRVKSPVSYVSKSL